MNGTAKMKAVIAATMTACAISAVGLAAAPSATATVAPSAAGEHAYNPDAPRGSSDNPIIIDGSSPLLTEDQQEALDQVKEDLASGKGQVNSATGAQSSAVKTSAVIRPNVLNNCGYSGFYYCNMVATTIGTVAMGTVLDNNSHEEAESYGNGKNSNNWASYMDQSRDGGATWTPELMYHVNYPDWSNPIYDGPGYYDRACLVDNQHNLYYCLPWH